jgi:uncharacterized membrane-anchored protein
VVGTIEESEVASPTHVLTKVPEVTFVFWLIKIAATTLGETGGDALSMSLGLGYLLSTVVFGAIFVGSVFAQIRAKKFQPSLYWLTIIASTTVGTTLADFADRSLGVGYAGGTTILLLCLVGSLLVWHRTLGTISVNTIFTRKAEVFYWVTIMFSQTLGTALGDWTADTAGIGFAGGTILFSVLILLVAGGYYFTRISRVTLFWLAFVLSRPLGAVIGDLLDKPLDEGGLDLSRFTASGVLLAFVIICVLLFEQKPAKHAH